MSTVDSANGQKVSAGLGSVQVSCWLSKTTANNKKTQPQGDGQARQRGSGSLRRFEVDSFYFNATMPGIGDIVFHQFNHIVSHRFRIGKIQNYL